MREQRPGDASILVGQRNSRDILVASDQQMAQPVIGLMGSMLEVSKHGARSVDELSSARIGAGRALSPSSANTGLPLFRPLPYPTLEGIQAALDFLAVCSR